jgi:hypothetical protein
MRTRALIAHQKVGYAYPRQTESGMTLKLYTDAVLTCDVPEHRLKRGDIVKFFSPTQFKAAHRIQQSLGGADER